MSSTHSGHSLYCASCREHKASGPVGWIQHPFVLKLVGILFFPFLFASSATGSHFCSFLLKQKLPEVLQPKRSERFLPATFPLQRRLLDASSSDRV